MFVFSSLLPPEFKMMYQCLELFKKINQRATPMLYCIGFAEHASIDSGQKQMIFPFNLDK